MNVLYFCSALIRVVRQTLDDNHLAAVSLVRSFYRSAAYLVSFQDVHTGSAVGSGSLQGAQLNGTGLAADIPGNIACQIIGSTGKLLVAKGVNKVDALSQLAYITSVVQTDSFGNSDDSG